MFQRLFGVRGRDLGMALFAMIDGFFEMINTFGGMGGGLCLFAGFSMFKCFFGVRNENAGMAHLAMFDGLLRMKPTPPATTSRTRASDIL
jgi:hypothetical protein